MEGLIAMMSKEQNERLTRVGAGTHMGELLRRYCVNAGVKIHQWPE